MISCFGSQVQKLWGQPLHLEASELTNLIHSRRKRRDKDVKTEFRGHCVKPVLGNDEFFPIFGVYIPFLFACVFWLKFELRFCHLYPKPWHMYRGQGPIGKNWSRIGCPCSFLCILYLKSTSSRKDDRDASMAEAQVAFPLCMIEEGLKEQNHLVQKMMTSYRKGWGEEIMGI